MIKASFKSVNAGSKYNKMIEKSLNPLFAKWNGRLSYAWLVGNAKFKTHSPTDYIP